MSAVEMKATSYQEKTHCESLNAISYHLDEQLRKKCKKKQKKSQTDWVWLNLHRRREKYKTIEAEHSYGLVI